MSDSSDSGGEGPSSGPIKKKKYGQTCKEKWEELPEFKGWVARSKKGSQFAKCESCYKDINIVSGTDALIKHSISKFQITKVEMISKQTKLSAFATPGTSKTVIDEKIKKGEIRLATDYAEHNLSFLLMDHLIKAIAARTEKIAKGLSSGRHKTSAIVKNILGHEGLTSLCDHLRKYKFSLVVDQSTDRRTTFS
ncbi:hypothetical protein BDFB_008509 [Asbolus verrucosus]|uniref:BED-type domain-containing protein n=1 Tax=Asbolus verrucosus TaxID=1661398 RepID=A0A482W8M3_ASBVE|nr:hypothetical protein BDFB_008509 [Asbolus verrucosus]